MDYELEILSLKKRIEDLEKIIYNKNQPAKVQNICLKVKFILKTG